MRKLPFAIKTQNLSNTLLCISVIPRFLSCILFYCLLAIFQFLITITFTDETIFRKCRITNIRNESFRADENPHALRDSWCRLVHQHILQTPYKSIFFFIYLLEYLQSMLVENFQ